MPMSVEITNLALAAPALPLQQLNVISPAALPLNGPLATIAHPRKETLSSCCRPIARIQRDTALARRATCAS